MAKKRRVKSKESAFKSTFVKMNNKLSTWFSDLKLGKRLLRFGLMVLIIGVVVGGGILGLKQMEKYTSNLAVFTSSEVSVSLYNQPEWMSESLAQQILRESFLPIKDKLRELHHQGLDKKLPEVLAGELGFNPWVSKVHWVRRSFGGKFVIDADFRQPTAMVKLDEGCYLIDDAGYLLPGKYKYDALLECGLMEIHGVKSRLPDQGQRWSGKDLQAGLALVKLLKTVEFRQQVKAVNVSNYEGRCDRNSSWMTLETDRHTTIRWGRPVGEEGGLENTANDKVALLRGAYADYQHIDCNRVFIDVTRSQNSVDASVAAVGSQVGN